MAILKTDISNGYDFKKVQNKLQHYYKINECTIDLDDRDKVVRVIGSNIRINDLVNKIRSYGFSCEELPD